MRKLCSYAVVLVPFPAETDAKECRFAAILEVNAHFRGDGNAVVRMRVSRNSQLATHAHVDAMKVSFEMSQSE